jgi:proline dehydrogenase
VVGANVVNGFLRRAILAAADSRRLRAVVRRHGMRLGAGRFVAGETLDAALSVLRRLDDQGLLTNTTLLGEAVTTEAEAGAVTAAYLDVLAALGASGVRTNVALKLTHLGLSLGEDLAFVNVARLVEAAAGHRNFIRIDMEDSPTVDATLRTYRRLREAGHDNVGTVLQAYLYRTDADLTALTELRPNLRLVKGAYREPPAAAFPQKADVDANFARLSERMLLSDGFTAIATHDERLIDHAIRVARDHGVPRERFQFQMLYGVRSRLQMDLVARGYPVLVATPYGHDWYPYLMRRLAERPANLLFFAKSVVRR